MGWGDGGGGISSDVKGVYCRHRLFSISHSVQLGDINEKFMTYLAADPRIITGMK